MKKILYIVNLVSLLVVTVTLQAQDFSSTFSARASGSPVFYPTAGYAIDTSMLRYSPDFISFLSQPGTEAEAQYDIYDARRKKARAGQKSRERARRVQEYQIRPQGSLSDTGSRGPIKSTPELERDTEV